MKYILLIPLLLFFHPLLFSQSEIQEPVFLENTPDSIIFKTYLDSLDYYLDANHNIAQQYIELCDKFLEKNPKISNKAKAIFIHWKIFHETNMNNYMIAYQLLKDNRNIFTTDIPEGLKQEIKYVEGLILSALGDLEGAQKIFTEYIKYGEENNIEDIKNIGLFSLANIQFSQESYEDAINNYMKVFEYEKSDSVPPVNRIITILELSEAHFQMGNQNERSYFDSLGLALAYEVNNPSFIFDFHLKIVEQAIHKKDFKKAQQYLQIAEEMLDELKFHRHTSTYNFVLAKYYVSQNKYKDALSIYEQMVKADTKENPSHTLGLYEDIHIVYSNLGKHEKAYDYLLKNKILQDSILNVSNLQKVQFLNTKFEVEQKEKQNQLLATKVIQKQTQNKYLYVIVGLFLLGTIALFGIVWQKFKYNKNLKQEVIRQTQKLRDTNIELEQFNYIVSHDLKEPVRNIIGFSTLGKRKIDDDHPISEYLQYIANNGQQLYALIEDISTFHKIEKIDNNKTEPIDLNQLMEKIEDSILSTIEKKRGKIHYDNLPTIQSHQSILFLVLKNLIENGLKYNENDFPKIQISYKKENDQHHIFVEDNGIGIDPEFHANVFGMFKRLNHRGKYKGSGLGLSLSQKTIKKLDGNVAILNSEPGKGSTFKITFPDLTDLQKTNAKKIELLNLN